MIRIAFTTLASILILNLATSASSYGARSTRRATSVSNRRPASENAEKAEPAPSKWPAVITPADNAANETFQKYRKSMIRITVSLDGVPISTGNGFFTAADGTFLTSFLVVRAAIFNSKTKIEFKLADGSTQNSFTIASCGDQRNLDLCKLKIPVASKKFLTLNPVNSGPGNKNILVAHTGTDYTAFAAITSSIESTLANVENQILSLRVHDEGLGAPILDYNGDVAGMAANLGAVGFGEYGVLAASELNRFNSTHSQFTDTATFARQFKFDSAQAANAKAKTIIAPAFKQALVGHSLSGNKQFREAKLDFGNEQIKFFIPSAFDECYFSGRTGILTGNNSLALASCAAKDGSSLITIERIHVLKRGLLAKMNKHRLVDPKPLAAVEHLDANQRWHDFDKSLKKGQRADFFSNPSLSSCQRLAANPLPKSFFSSAIGCRFNVKADATLGGYTSSLWIENGNYIYGINVWMDDESTAPFLGNLASLVALTTQNMTVAVKVQPSATKSTPKPNPKPGTPNGKAQFKPSKSTEPRSVASTGASGDAGAEAIAGTSAKKPGSYYKMNLPNGVTFLDSKRRADNTQFDTYGFENALGEALTSYVLVVDRMNAVFRPSDYDRSLAELVKSVSAALRVRVSVAKDHFDTTTLDGLPGRLVSTMGTRDGKEVLILMVVGFGPNDTHLITQISDSNNPTKSFADFRVMSSSFKRK